MIYLVAGGRAEPDTESLLRGAVPTMGTRPDPAFPLRHALLYCSLHTQLAHQTRMYHSLNVSNPASNPNQFHYLNVNANILWL